jgi:hypothetical protein
MTTPIGKRFVVNPIPYWSKAGKTREVFEEAFADFAKIGYSAVKADVPDGMEAQEYMDWIGSYGLAPAISLFSSPFDETIDITEEVERGQTVRPFAGGARPGPDHDLFHGHPHQDGPSPRVSPIAYQWAQLNPSGLTPHLCRLLIKV